MKVCIVAEGCYPYVVGGVSGWINSLIRSFPNVEFILLAIVANRSFRGKFVYELPENLTQVYEVYLDDCEWESGNRKRKSLRQVHLSHKEYDEMLNMVLNRRTDWGVIFDLFHRKHLSVDDFLILGFPLDAAIHLSADVLGTENGCTEGGFVSLCGHRLFWNSWKYGKTFSWKFITDLRAWNLYQRKGGRTDQSFLGKGSI